MADGLANSLFTHALIHEIGHTLGLSHPFENGLEILGSDVEPLDSALDYVRYSVMAYALNPPGIEDSSAERSVSSSIMPLDVQALQYLYGIASNTENDIYAIGPPTGQLFSAITNEQISAFETLTGRIFTDFVSHQYLNSYLAISDNGVSQDGPGENVLIIELDEDITLNLAPASWSDTGGGFGGTDPNLFIDNNTHIALAVTAAGNDTISAGAAGHSIYSRGGDDAVFAGAGIDLVFLGDGDDHYVGDNTGSADEIYGGPGDDNVGISHLQFGKIDGGEDTDTVKFTAALNLDLTGGAYSGTLLNLEAFDFSQDGGSSELLLDLVAIQDITDQSDHLALNVDSNDLLTLYNGGTGGWEEDLDWAVEGESYYQYIDSELALAAVTVSGVVFEEAVLIA